ncbi:hypothetical protein VTJ04DRAFT_9344 [Mycothermus thermophilus]|uniref:uncharacterized protein n=1 Tax=Humicola insolens TaxID=85995 RepID=UPI003743FD63
MASLNSPSGHGSPPSPSELPEPKSPTISTETRTIHYRVSACDPDRVTTALTSHTDRFPPVHEVFDDLPTPTEAPQLLFIVGVGSWTTEAQIDQSDPDPFEEIDLSDDGQDGHHQHDEGHPTHVQPPSVAPNSPTPSVTLGRGGRDSANQFYLHNINRFVAQSIFDDSTLHVRVTDLNTEPTDLAHVSRYHIRAHRIITSLMSSFESSSTGVIRSLPGGNEPGGGSDSLLSEQVQ